MFHAKDGWQFGATELNAVKIVAPSGESVVLDYDTWCSVIAEVSRRGGTSQTVQEAHEFHRAPVPGTGIE